MNVLLKSSGAILGSTPWHPGTRAKEGKIRVERRLRPVRVPASCRDATPLIPVIDFDVVDEFILADEPCDAFHLPGFVPADLLAGQFRLWQMEVSA